MTMRTTSPLGCPRGTDPDRFRENLGERLRKFRSGTKPGRDAAHRFRVVCQTEPKMQKGRQAGDLDFPGFTHISGKCGHVKNTCPRILSGKAGDGSRASLKAILSGGCSRDILAIPGDTEPRVDSRAESVVVILFVFLRERLSALKRRKCLSFAFIAANFEQLLACGVFWREAVLDVRFEQ